MKNITTWWLGLLLLVILGACSTARETEGGVHDPLGDFRSWVNTTTTQIAGATAEEWQQARQDFKTRTQELDPMQSSFSEDIKQEYAQLKQNFADTDALYVQSHQEAELAAWQRKLLGNWADLAAVNETNVEEAYTTFLENMRTAHKSWIDQDWRMASMVMNALDKRKEQIIADIPTDTEVKIKALQIEFHALEAAANVEIKR